MICIQIIFRQILSLLPDCYLLDNDDYVSFIIVYPSIPCSGSDAGKNVNGSTNVKVFIKFILWLSVLLYIPSLYKTHFCFSPFCLLLTRRLYLRDTPTVCALDLFWEHISTGILHRTSAKIDYALKLCRCQLCLKIGVLSSFLVSLIWLQLK